MTQRFNRANACAPATAGCAATGRIALGEKQIFFCGDRVTYRNVNLWNYSGTIVALGKTAHGGDCMVTWDRFPLQRNEECTFNLRLI